MNFRFPPIRGRERAECRNSFGDVARGGGAGRYGTDTGGHGGPGHVTAPARGREDGAAGERGPQRAGAGGRGGAGGELGGRRAGARARAGRGPGCEAAGAGREGRASRGGPGGASTRNGTRGGRACCSGGCRAQGGGGYVAESGSGGGRVGRGLGRRAQRSSGSPRMQQLCPRANH